MTKSNEILKIESWVNAAIANHTCKDSKVMKDLIGLKENIANKKQ